MAMRTMGIALASTIWIAACGSTSTGDDAESAKVAQAQSACDELVPPDATR